MMKSGAKCRCGCRRVNWAKRGWGGSEGGVKGGEVVWDDVELLALAGCGFSGEAGAPVLSSSSCTRGRDTRVRGNAGKRA